MNWNIKTHMVSCNSIYPLPRDGAFSAHINGDINIYKKQKWFTGTKTVMSMYKCNYSNSYSRFKLLLDQLLLLEALKTYFHRFFHLILNELNKLFKITKYQWLNYWQRLWLYYKFLCNIFSNGTQPFYFIKSNIIKKLAY